MIPHNYDWDENRISVKFDASASEDEDFPYGFASHQYHSLWSFVSGPENTTGEIGEYSDLMNVNGEETHILSMTIGNPHENGQKEYTWELKVWSDYPVRVDNDGDYNTCGGNYTDGDTAPGGDLDQWDWATKADSANITVTVEEEPNIDPNASDALELIRGADGKSVLTSDDYDNAAAGGSNDFNDYDAGDARWYEPHDNSGALNPADLYFSADNSVDGNGICDGGDGDNISCDDGFLED